MWSNIPASPAYGVYISQLIRYSRASSNYSDFLKRHLFLRNMLLLSWPLSSNSRYKSKNDADEAVSVVSLISSSWWYINGRNSANLGLLIDKTSSIYLYVKLKRDHRYSFVRIIFGLIPRIWRQWSTQY
jgi:hypothetical protein